MSKKWENEGMFIIEKIKEDWLLSVKVLIGVLVIVLFIFFFRNMLFILAAILIIIAIYIVFLFVVGSLMKSYKTGFMGFFILIACMIYNPNLESVNLFIKELSIEKSHYVDNIKVINHSDWVIFSIYTVDFSSNKSYVDDNNQTQIKKISLPSQYYIGILKNFWNITKTSKQELYAQTANGDTLTHRVRDIIYLALSKVGISLQEAKLDAMIEQDIIKGETLFDILVKE